MEPFAPVVREAKLILVGVIDDVEVYGAIEVNGGRVILLVKDQPLYGLEDASRALLTSIAAAYEEARLFVG